MLGVLLPVQCPAMASQSVTQASSATLCSQLPSRQGKDFNSNIMIRQSCCYADHTVQEYRGKQRRRGRGGKGLTGQAFGRLIWLASTDPGKVFTALLQLLAPREIALGPSEIFHRLCRHSYNPFDKIMERRKLSDLFAALFSQSEKNMEKLVSPILLEYPTDCFFSSTSAVNQ